MKSSCFNELLLLFVGDVRLFTRDDVAAMDWHVSRILFSTFEFDVYIS